MKTLYDSFKIVMSCLSANFDKPLSSIIMMIFEFQLSSPINLLLYMHDLFYVGILPAPNDVHYIEDSPGYLQTLWGPPIIEPNELDLQNISIRRDARIIHYTIYITTEESTIVQVYNTSETSFAIGIDKIPCSFWFQVAAVNPAGVGERSPPQNLTFDCELA